MTDFLQDILATVLFAGVGVVLLALGYWMLHLLTPGNLAQHVFVDHRRDASLVLGSTLLSVGGIVAVAIFGVEGDTWSTLAQAAAFGLLGVMLQGLAFVLLDAITPGKLGDTLTDHKDDSSVWVVVAVQLALGLIIMASLT